MRRGWSERINDAVKENKVIDYKKEKRTDLSVIAQLTRLGNITESSLNNNLSEFRKKVNRFREKRNIKYSFSKEETDMLLKAMENGGMIRIDVENNNYSKKEEYVYSIRFWDNKTVASPVTTPAPSEQVRVNLGNTTANSIPQNSEKSTPTAKKVPLSAKRRPICFIGRWRRLV